LPTHIANLVFTPTVLLQLGLHPTRNQPEALQRFYVKKTTALYYKQYKFNLLRESSEGFSALIVLLTSPTALSSPDAEPESEERAQERAGIVWSRVMGLIGYFNLSPPRVLDLILEIASCHCALHWRFFLELIKCSPWGRNAESIGKGKQRASSDGGDGIEGVMDGSGDRVLSQVLGAKYGFAQVSFA
jgi:THO complex subunit 2